MGERSAKIDSFAQAFSVAAELHSPAGVLDRLRRFISKTSRMRVYTTVEYKPTISNRDTSWDSTAVNSNMDELFASKQPLTPLVEL